MPTPRAYFDTSVLLKRYFHEPASDQARSFAKRYRIVSSAIALVETFSALSGRRVSGVLTDRAFAAIGRKIQDDRLRWDLVGVSPSVVDRAEELVVKTLLRTLDALHVASALTFQATTGMRIPFITADERQREAAGLLGFTVLWVG